MNTHTNTPLTERELQHWVHFLTHVANYKVTIFEPGTEFNINTTDELLANARQLIKRFYSPASITRAEAKAIALDYRYDDDCINEGIEEQWQDYCAEHGLENLAA